MEDVIKQEKWLGDYTKKEFLEMENFGSGETFNEIVIVPTRKKHDSGYLCMKFILAYHGEIVGVVSGWSDVVHINGIGGYGEKWFGLRQTMPRVDWEIDCLPKSGCLRLFSSKDCVVRDSFIGSDFVFFVKE